MKLVQFVVYIFGFLLSTPLVECQNVDFADRAFVSVWNAPSGRCERIGVPLNLSYFDIVVNQNDTFAGDEIVIFYGSSLGLYPTISKQGGQYINGGIPQLANITAHLAKVTRDVERLMPNVNFNGLAVLDWESWRPMFERDNYNQGMRRYIQASKDLVLKKHPDWSKEKVEQEAQKEFESAARTFIESTLEKCRELRPGGYWGLYMFPSCYNYGVGEKYCGNATMVLNDRLSWLYNASTSLYPSIYLQYAGTPMDRYNHVYGQLKEAVRVKKLYGGKYLPIVPYSKIRYGTTLFYNQSDLNNTIRQVADAGLNAIVLWGSSSSFRSRENCELLRDYLDSTLGPFIVNVTINAQKCSDELCNSHGRCFKTDWSYKSKAPETLFFESASKGFLAKLFEKLSGIISSAISDALLSVQRNIGAIDLVKSDRFEEVRERYSGFSCSCFKGWTGQYCQQILTV